LLLSPILNPLRQKKEKKEMEILGLFFEMENK
jgi:hypothetical protein